MRLPTLRDVLDESGVSWKYYSPPVHAVPARYGMASTPSKPYVGGPQWNTNVTKSPKRILTDIPTARCRRCRGSFPTTSTPIIPAIGSAIPDHRGSRRSSMRSVKAPTGKQRPSSSSGTIGEVSTITCLRRFSTTRAASVFACRCSSSRLGAPRGPSSRRLRQSPAVRVRQHPAVRRGYLRSRSHRHDGRARDQHLGLLRFHAETAAVYNRSQRNTRAPISSVSRRRANRSTASSVGRESPWAPRRRLRSYCRRSVRRPSLR